MVDDDARTRFIAAALWHGELGEAEAILAKHPDVATSDVHTAAILGDDLGLARFLANDPTAATSTSGPHGWNALTHLCFSRFLRLDSQRSAGFERCARLLLDAGASATSGFDSPDHQPGPAWESVLYGAAGVAHHEGITRLLLAHGADPNDGETVYHAPETRDNAALRALLESKDLTADSLAVMLLRKADWHDLEGIQLLLARGADPNRLTHWRVAAIHQALQRDNSLEIIDALLDGGADPTLARPADGSSPAAIAARRGRADVLRRLSERGVATHLAGLEQLLAACAGHDDSQARALAAKQQLLAELKAGAGRFLAEFSGNDNTEGVRLLLDLGLEVDALHEGDPYFDLAPRSTALHNAAWRAAHATVRLLLARHADVDRGDGKGRSPLALAVKACVDSYWADRRSPESVRALLAAGASTRGLSLPTGYAEIDALLGPHFTDKNP
jgi:ankyrin repeat protein